MDCEYVSSRLKQFLLEEMEKAEYKSIAEHTAECALCAEKLAEQRNKLKKACEIPEMPEPDGTFRKNLLRAVHSEIALARTQNISAKRMRKAAAAILLAGAAVTAVAWLLNRDGAEKVTLTQQPVYMWKHRGISSVQQLSFDAPVVFQKRVYAIRKNDAGSSLVALETDTGRRIWNSDSEVTGYTAADPRHVLGISISSDGIATLKCFNAETGKLLWTYQSASPSSACSVPEITGQGIFWSPGNSLHCITAAGGTEKWSRTFPVKGLISNPEAVQNSVMIIAGNVLYKLSKTDGKTIHSWQLTGTPPSRTHRPLLAATPSAVGAVLFKTPSWKADLVCFSPDNEKIIWRRETGAVSHINIAGNAVIVRAGNVYAYSADSGGTLQWQYKAAGCSPVSFAENRLYFFNTAGKGSLVVLKPDNGSVETTYRLPPSCAGITVTGTRGIINAQNGVLYSFML